MRKQHIFLALLCAMVLSTPAFSGCFSAPHPNAGPVHLWAERVEHVGLPNLHKVSNSLYRGAQPTAEGFIALKQMGVRTVVCLRAYHDDADVIATTPLECINIPTQALHIDDEDVISFLKVATDPACMPVFVHCMQGSDRTGTMVAAYRVVVQGWSKEEALMEMTQGEFGFHGFPNLVRYIRNLDVEKMRREIGLTTTAEVAENTPAPVPAP